MASRAHIFNWIDSLPGDGRYTFTRQDAEEASGSSFVAVQSSLRRLKKRGRIVSPRRGFYVLVPPEYREAGSPPASWFIDDLMRFCRCDYYAGLLTAAALHGASHQKPMVFQVLTDRLSATMKAGRVTIQARRSRAVGRSPVQPIQTETGTMTVSTPEATALDLVRFPRASGGWNNIATVLVELVERMDPDRLIEAAETGRVSDVQRLGYLLDLLRKERLARPLAEWLVTRRTTIVPLRTDMPLVGREPTPRWHVTPNEDVEPDL
jgi:predicted transcriptional regulator of viral defense system